jgi:hypothetical protein
MTLKSQAFRVQIISWDLPILATYTGIELIFLK